MEAGPPEPIGGEITALRARKGRSDRVVVRFADAPDVELAAMVVDGAGLRAGLVVSEAELARLQREDEPHRARSRALKFLAMRDRSATEVADRLRRNGFGGQTVTDTVDWLFGLGYLDDRRFAQRFAAEKLKSGWGGGRVRGELVKRGVERALVDEVLDTETQDPEVISAREEAMARLVQRRFSGQFADDPVGTARRVAGYLARRGHDWDTVDRMIRHLKGETTETTE